MDTKFILLSKTILGGLVLLVTVFKLVWGVELASQDELEGAVTALVGLFGFGLVVFGRFKASGKITLSPKKGEK